VTGPHLHWAVRWQGAYLDPVKLLHMNLNLNGTDAAPPRSTGHTAHKRG
jgi:murein DD-endopeptidase MepM/ murein hydrolase activator NlpD